MWQFVLDFLMLTMKFSFLSWQLLNKVLVVTEKWPLRPPAEIDHGHLHIPTADAASTLCTVFIYSNAVEKLRVEVAMSPAPAMRRGVSSTLDLALAS